MTHRERTAHNAHNAPTAQEVGIDDKRVAEMLAAVELEVDRDEFRFTCDRERVVWSVLEVEFEERAEREGRRWVPLDAA